MIEAVIPCCIETRVGSTLCAQIEIAGSLEGERKAQAVKPVDVALLHMTTAYRPLVC
jgi:hypothetical protein